ncbi:hypothetical protein JAAARDRAFT_63872 [Jaapia argillacea MUCL 33604]|uniref:Uncharacterized protein n=1 Tax=Jaapia argillacea MUCL 33604 TaxID=933084 RepID=A0A067PEX4_9AGAM|nr:hypothetical protein JAAARDRAFT_63872 [Jaapia argillacea MUCL 33604]
MGCSRAEDEPAGAVMEGLSKLWMTERGKTPGRVVQFAPIRVERDVPALRCFWVRMNLSFHVIMGRRGSILRKHHENDRYQKLAIYQGWAGGRGLSVMW